MGAFSIWHILLVGVVAVLVFGAGRIPLVMGELGKGVKAFKKGMNDVTGAKDVDNARHS